MTDFDDKALRDWLLHRLGAEREAELEQALFTDAELADRIDETRCDLYDDYAHGRLSADERNFVRQHLAAAPAEAERLRIACALAEVRPAIRQQSVPSFVRRRRNIAFIGALAACVLVGFGALWWQGRIPRSGTSDRGSSRMPLPVLTLLASQQRGEGTTLALPNYASGVRVQAEVDVTDTSTKTYRLRITDAGQTRFEAYGLTVQQAGPYHYVESAVPAGVLGPGTHRISVGEENGTAMALTWDVVTRSTP